MFCINLFRLGLNPKAIQKIMGYANTSTTLDTYTHMEDILNSYKDDRSAS